MGLLISTQSYRKDTPTPYGLLLELNETDGQIVRQIKIDTPIDSSEGGRLKPGLRGLFEYQNKIYTSSWNSVFVINRDNLEIEQTISHKWMSDLHGIFVDSDGIWVTSSYPDALILYDFEGNPKASFWVPESFVYQERSQVDKDMDWRFKGKDFRGFREFHANHVEVVGPYVYLTGRGEKLKNGRILQFRKETFISQGKLSDQDIKIYHKGLFGPHDGVWQEEELWVTETNRGSIASINKKGKITFRKTILSKEGEKVKYDGFKDLMVSIYKRLRQKQIKKVTHWTRGLCFTNSSIFVGQSTWAGDEALARVVEVDKNTKKITSCYYLDIPNYPETRIFQLIKI